MATLRHTTANIVSVLVTTAKLAVMKLIYPKNLYFGFPERFSPNVVIDTDSKSKLYFGNRVSIHSNGRISSHAGGQLKIGDNTSFNIGCIVVCRDSVNIGRNVSFGPNVLIYDHNHIIGEFGVKNTPFVTKPVFVGDNSWIGAGVIILAGSQIGKNCVIGAGSVVSGVVPDNTTLIQKRNNVFLET